MANVTQIYSVVTIAELSIQQSVVKPAKNGHLSLHTATAPHLKTFPTLDLGIIIIVEILTRCPEEFGVTLPTAIFVGSTVILEYRTAYVIVSENI